MEDLFDFDGIGFSSSSTAQHEEEQGTDSSDLDSSLKHLFEELLGKTPHEPDSNSNQPTGNGGEQQRLWQSPTTSTSQAHVTASSPWPQQNLETEQAGVVVVAGVKRKRGIVPFKHGSASKKLLLTSAPTCELSPGMADCPIAFASSSLTDTPPDLSSRVENIPSTPSASSPSPSTPSTLAGDSSARNVAAAAVDDIETCPSNVPIMRYSSAATSTSSLSDAIGGAGHHNNTARTLNGTNPAGAKSSKTAGNKDCKRRKVGQACVACRKAHVSCDDTRPCKRCVKKNIAHLCVDAPKKNEITSTVVSAKPTGVPIKIRPAPVRPAPAASNHFIRPPSVPVPSPSVPVLSPFPPNNSFVGNNVMFPSMISSATPLPPQLQHLTPMNSPHNVNVSLHASLNTLNSNNTTNIHSINNQSNQSTNKQQTQTPLPSNNTVNTSTRNLVMIPTATGMMAVVPGVNGLLTVVPVSAANAIPSIATPPISNASIPPPPSPAALQSLQPLAPQQHPIPVAPPTPLPNPLTNSTTASSPSSTTFNSDSQPPSANPTAPTPKDADYSAFPRRIPHPSTASFSSSSSSSSSEELDFSAFDNILADLEAPHPSSWQQSQQQSQSPVEGSCAPPPPPPPPLPPQLPPNYANSVPNPCVPSSLLKNLHVPFLFGNDANDLLGLSALTMGLDYAAMAELWAAAVSTPANEQQQQQQQAVQIDSPAPSADTDKGCGVGVDKDGNQGAPRNELGGTTKTASSEQHPGESICGRYASSSSQCATCPFSKMERFFLKAAGDEESTDGDHGSAKAQPAGKRPAPSSCTSGAMPLSERLSEVLKEKWKAGLLQPYNYAVGYARLVRYLETSEMSSIARQRVLAVVDHLQATFPSPVSACWKRRQLSEGKTTAAFSSLCDDEEVDSDDGDVGQEGETKLPIGSGNPGLEDEAVSEEEQFERYCLEYDRIFHTFGTPACLWRRTGEICRANAAFAELVGMEGEADDEEEDDDADFGHREGVDGDSEDVSASLFRDGKCCIYEFMTEDSVVRYWEQFADIATETEKKAVITECVLLYRPKVVVARQEMMMRKSKGGQSKPSCSKGGRPSSGVLAQQSDPLGVVPCSISFTVRRNSKGVPICIVGNFLPVNPAVVKRLKKKRAVAAAMLSAREGISASFAAAGLIPLSQLPPTPLVSKSSPHTTPGVPEGEPNTIDGISNYDENAEQLDEDNLYNEPSEEDDDEDDVEEDQDEEEEEDDDQYESDNPSYPPTSAREGRALLSSLGQALSLLSDLGLIPSSSNRNGSRGTQKTTSGSNSTGSRSSNGATSTTEPRRPRSAGNSKRAQPPRRRSSSQNPQAGQRQNGVDLDGMIPRRRGGGSAGTGAGARTA
ncbi:hypothetical protein HK102_008396, partial [Quaeritorhiza haematococci]